MITLELILYITIITASIDQQVTALLPTSKAFSISPFTIADFNNSSACFIVYSNSLT